jgi:hypothetical protein
VSKLAQAHKREKDRENVYTIFFNLLTFSVEKQLFVFSPFDVNGNILKDRDFHKSDLSELGKEVFIDLMFDWLSYTDNESGKIDRNNNVKMLEKYYNKIVKDLNISN